MILLIISILIKKNIKLYFFFDTFTVVNIIILKNFINKYYIYHCKDLFFLLKAFKKMIYFWKVNIKYYKILYNIAYAIVFIKSIIS